MSLYIAQFNFPNVCYIDPIGLSGGLCLLWKDGIEMQVLDISLNMIHCKVNIDAKSGYSLVTFLYGALNDVNRNQQWNHMQNIAIQTNIPWLVIGDMNFILK